MHGHELTVDKIHKNIIESLYKKQLDIFDEIEYNALKCESETQNTFRADLSAEAVLPVYSRTGRKRADHVYYQE